MQLRFAILFPNKFCQAFPNLKSAAWRPASERDKFLSGVKTDRFVYVRAMIWEI